MTSCELSPILLDSMRHLLAILALIGLLLSPAAASAAAMRCTHEHGAMAMTAEWPPTTAEIAGATHDCCDEDQKSSEHDSKACAQDCAVMCGVSVALPDAQQFGMGDVRAARLAVGPADGLRPFAPPGLKRPPRPIA